MSEEKPITGEEIAMRISKLASQGVSFADPMQTSMTYIRALLIYLIENLDGLSLSDAECRYYEIMHTILTNAEQAAIKQRIVGGGIITDNGHSL